MPVLPSGQSPSLAQLMQGLWNEAGNQRSAGLAMRNVLFERQRDRDNRLFAALQVAREHELRRKEKHERRKAGERGAIGSVVGAGAGALVGGPLLGGGLAGAAYGAGTGVGTGQLFAGQPQGASTLSQSLMQLPGAVTQFQRGRTQIEQLRLQTDLIDNLFHRSGEGAGVGTGATSMGPWPI